MARAAAIQHIEEMVAEAEETLWVLRHSGSFWEYEILLAETKGREKAQVQAGGTLI